MPDSTVLHQILSNTLHYQYYMFHYTDLILTHNTQHTGNYSCVFYSSQQ